MIKLNKDRLQQLIIERNAFVVANHAMFSTLERYNGAIETLQQLVSDVETTDGAPPDLTPPP